MALLTTNHPSNVQARLEELERRNQLLEAEIERLRVYKDYAYTDALTEIPNRRFYYERLLQEIARARRSASPLTLALVDLDLFQTGYQRDGRHVRVGRDLTERREHQPRLAGLRRQKPQLYR